MPDRAALGLGEPDTGTLERVTAWVLVNRLLAGWRVGVAGEGRPAAVEAAVDSLSAEYESRLVPAGPGEVDTALLTGAEGEGWEVEREAVVFPNAPGPPAPEQLRLAPGSPPELILLVPGSGRKGPDGAHRLDPQALDRLAAAVASIPESGSRALILLSGWSGDDSGLGRTEAEMLAGGQVDPDVPVILEPAARTTAENCLFACELARCFEVPPRVVAFQSWSNSLRTRLLLRRAGKLAGGVETRVETISGPGHGRYLRPGISGLFFMGRHLGWGRSRLATARKDGHDTRAGRPNRTGHPRNIT